jgi:hypothetical protein
MQIISAGSSLIFLQADLSKTSNNRRDAANLLI